MICPPCAAAGDITAAVKRDQARPATSPPATVAKVHALHLDEAAALHGKCRGRTWCDCQHATPDRAPAPEPAENGPNP
jgi:hypothetical protein